MKTIKKNEWAQGLVDYALIIVLVVVVVIVASVFLGYDPVKFFAARVVNSSETAYPVVEETDAFASSTMGNNITATSTPLTATISPTRTVPPTSEPSPTPDHRTFVHESEASFEVFPEIARYLYANETAIDQAEWLVECMASGRSEDECGYGMFIPCSQLPNQALYMYVLGLPDVWPALVAGDVTLADQLPGIQADYFTQNLGRYSGLNPARYVSGEEYCILTRGHRVVFSDFDFGPEMCFDGDPYLPCDLFLIFENNKEDAIFLYRDPTHAIRSGKYVVWYTPSDLSQVRNETASGINPQVVTIFFLVNGQDFLRDWRLRNEFPTWGAPLLVIQTSTGVDYYVNQYKTMFTEYVDPTPAP